MTAHSFLIEKGVLSLNETYSIYVIKKWLEEYGDCLSTILESDIQCTGNNGNGCFLDSCENECGCINTNKL